MRHDRFTGCLLGLAIGDALGGHFEAQSPEWIRGRYPTVEAIFQNPPKTPWYYTDDTQMAIGVAEALLQDGEIVEQTLYQRFVSNYEEWRGYGRGARMILEACRDGKDHRFWVEEQFPGGSYGNGAAMRVAPVGLLFHDDLETVRKQAELSARPTHIHLLGIEGAQLLAVAIAHVVQMEKFDEDAFFSLLLTDCRSPEFRDKLIAARDVNSPSGLHVLGNGIAAQDSVVTAIACFTLSPDSYQTAIGTAIRNGGDTDTIAAMAGALSGANLGQAAIPQGLIDSLEKTPKGSEFLIQLATNLACAKRNP